jgi:hypothetical protein
LPEWTIVPASKELLAMVKTVRACFRKATDSFLAPALGVMILLAGLATAPVRASEVIGAADMVSNRVTGELAKARRLLDIEDPVHLNEVVRTDTGASARFRFSDDSDLRLGSNAQIKLDAFVFSGKKSAAFQLTRGALRFFSGTGPHGSYQIRTPVATIGLRGTGIGIVVRAGRTYVTLLQGEARVCSRSGRCSTLTNPCDYVAVDRQNADAPQPLTQGVPTFNAACSGPACGEIICTASATSPAAPSRGYDPAGGGNGSGGSSGGGGKGTR